MRSTYFDLSRAILVLDASVAINLLGSSLSVEILGAIPSPVLMEIRAYREILRHPIQSRQLNAELDVWRREALLEVVSLSYEDRELFDDLTAKHLPTALDDGEAATIAYAVGASTNAVPVIDERKATRLFRKKWPTRGLIDSVTLFRTLAKAGLLAEEIVREAVCSALVHARMQVSRDNKQWVVTLIGTERAAQCPSLGRIQPI